MKAEIDYQIPRSALAWILVSVLLVVLPQAPNMPLWVLVIALCCVTWRWLIFLGRLNYPGRSVRIVIVIFTLALSVSQMSSLGVGLDTAASLLTLGFVFKLIEMRHKRDVYVVISLCFVLVMVAFLYSQSAVISLYMAAVLVVITNAMIHLNRSTRQGENTATLGMALKMGLQALPLTILLFLVFPRIAPLWAVPVQNSGNTTGVTDEMSPGDLAQLGRSSELAFRVQFADGMPPPLHENLYWRGLVLENYDGRSWTRSRRGSSYSEAASMNDFQWNWNDRVRLSDETIDYNVILEPTQQPWLYGLHLAEPMNEQLFQSRNFEIFNNGRITKRMTYDLRSYRNSQTDLILLDSARRRTTELPEGNSRSRELAQRLRAEAGSDRDYVYAVLAYIQQNEFFYTLNPALLAEQRVDDFLFNTREGFCEHYASSFTFLMRAVGIPARVVVGYQGAEYNRFEDYMMVYQYNAHAWTEVWLEGEGWVRFDPTAAVSPERIEQGVEAALANDPAFLEQSLFAAARLGSVGWLNTLRLRLDAIEYEWNRRVINYDEEVQVEIFERLLGDITEEKVVILFASLGAIMVLGIAIAIVWTQPRTHRNPADRLFVKMSEELARIGMARRRGEAPLDYCRRVSQEYPQLASEMRALTDLYVEINYRHKELAAVRQKQLLQELKEQSARLRFKLLPLRRAANQAG